MNFSKSTDNPRAKHFWGIFLSPKNIAFSLSLREKNIEYIRIHDVLRMDIFVSAKTSEYFSAFSKLTELGLAKFCKSKKW